MKKTSGFWTTMSITVALSAVLSITSFASGIQQTVDTNLKKDSLLDSASSASVVKDNISKIDLKSFKSKFASNFTVLKQLRTESKDLWALIKSSNESIKAHRKDFKTDLLTKDKTEKKSIIADMKSKIGPISAEVKIKNSEIKNLSNQKAAEWVNFKAAVKTRDESKASIALNNIISLKKQIFEKQKSLLDLKKEILNIID